MTKVKFTAHGRLAIRIFCFKDGQYVLFNYV